MYAGHARQECSPFEYARISLIVFVCTCSKCTIKDLRRTLVENYALSL